MAKKAANPKVKYKGVKPDEQGVLKAKIPATIVGPRIAFPHRHMAIIDTGLEAFTEVGYKLCFSLVPALQNRGMIATNAPGGIKAGKVQIAVLNSGREIVEIKDGDPTRQCVAGG
jgi:hypothetical protein